MLRLIARALPHFCFTQVMVLSMLAVLLPLFGLPWLGLFFALLAALGWGYWLFHAPLPTPISRAIGRERDEP